MRRVDRLVFSVSVVTAAALTSLGLGAEVSASPASSPPAIGTDPTTQATGIQVYVGGERVFNRPTTTSQPECVYPCASGTFQEAHLRDVTATLDGPGTNPVIVDATALTVTAHWHNCTFHEFDGSISCYRDIKLARATALARSVEIYMRDGALVDSRLSVGAAYSECAVDHDFLNGQAQPTTGRTTIGSLALDGGDLLHDGMVTGTAGLTDIPPNLVISLPGATLVLNEQSPAARNGVGPGHLGPLAVNALHVYTPDFEVIVGHSNCTR